MEVKKCISLNGDHPPDRNLKDNLSLLAGVILTQFFAGKKSRFDYSRE